MSTDLTTPCDMGHAGIQRSENQKGIDLVFSFNTNAGVQYLASLISKFWFRFEDSLEYFLCDVGDAGVQVKGLDGRVAGNEGGGEGGATAHGTAVRGATLRRNDGN